MHKQVFAFFILLTFLSCNSDSNQQGIKDVVEDTVFETVIDPGFDSTKIIKNAPILWTVDFEESTNTFKIKKPVNSRLDTLSAEKMVSLISWDSIHVDFLKTSHDTIYISIPDSEYLTQRIGSSGAENFMATTTFSLTEIKGMKYVNFNFTEGDHASPGIYSRKDFKNFE